MRTFRGLVAAAMIVAAGSAAAQQSTPTAQAALQRGLTAFQAGKQEIAVRALAEAAATGDASAKFVAEFYLARIYSEAVGAAADHTKAFMLFRKLADENVNIDPNVSQRAPFVAKALIALAGYMRAGVKEIGLAPNPRRAVDCLHHAAAFFGDKDAQFELARIYLTADALADDVKRGLHYLAVLTEESHPPAQALLADLFWRGRHMKKDERRALALVTMAVQHAPAHERMWIEESYAAIFCAAAPAMRQEADDIVARWRKVFARPEHAGGGLGASELLTERRCANGETVVVGSANKADAAAPASNLEAMKAGTAVLSFPAMDLADPAAKK
jgi:TPR repeat protein